ncbi:MAG: hypothetical protein K1X75_06880 [Leptospirales bacterium]|nr:hypothetical protein [Leptospirales bacterium]
MPRRRFVNPVLWIGPVAWLLAGCWSAPPGIELQISTIEETPWFFLLPADDRHGEFVAAYSAPALDSDLVEELAAARDRRLHADLESRSSRLGAELCALSPGNRATAAAQLQQRQRSQLSAWLAMQQHYHRQLEDALRQAAAQGAWPASRLERCLSRQRLVIELERERQETWIGAWSEWIQGLSREGDNCPSGKPEPGPALSRPLAQARLRLFDELAPLERARLILAMHDPQ